MNDGTLRASISFPVTAFPNEEACRKAAVDYFDLRLAAHLTPSPYGMGPVRKNRDGKLYHGSRGHEFIVYGKDRVAQMPKDKSCQTKILMPNAKEGTD